MGLKERDLRYEITLDLLKIDWPGSLESRRAGPFLGLIIECRKTDFRAICKLKDADICLVYDLYELGEIRIPLADPKCRETFVETVLKLWADFIQKQRDELVEEITDLEGTLLWYNNEAAQIRMMEKKDALHVRTNRTLSTSLQGQREANEKG